MRQLFTPGEDFIQFGWDYSSLEARIMGHFVYNYHQGLELAEILRAPKPNDWHQVVADKVGLKRSDVKSLNYGLIYGAQVGKVMKMLNCSKKEANKVFEDMWNAMPALKELKMNLENFWESTGKKYIISIDGRKIFCRSKHSLLNYLFQSSGVICTKYVFITIFEKLVSMGYNINPFKGKPDIISMIEYHDECQFASNNYFEFETFNTKEEAKKFVENWDEEQLSTIGEGYKYYVCKPNIISKTINESLEDVNKFLKLNVPLSMEYSLGRSWAQCH